MKVPLPGVNRENREVFSQIEKLLLPNEAALRFIWGNDYQNERRQLVGLIYAHWLKDKRPLEIVVDENLAPLLSEREDKNKTKALTQTIARIDKKTPAFKKDTELLDPIRDGLLLSRPDPKRKFAEKTVSETIQSLIKAQDAEIKKYRKMGYKIKRRSKKNLPVSFETIKEHTSTLYEACLPLRRYALSRNISYRRLHHALKKAAFSLPSSSKFDKRLFIDPRALDTILPSFKGIWQFEDKYRQWTDFLKKSGWSKSRASHWMQRKIIAKAVPEYYFFIVPPKDKFLDAVRRANKRKPINEPEGIWNHQSMPLTPKKQYALFHAPAHK